MRKRMSKKEEYVCQICGRLVKEVIVCNCDVNDVFYTVDLSGNKIHVEFNFEPVCHDCYKKGDFK